MMSDYYLEKFGINKENIIGKNISIYYMNNCIMKDYTVCGEKNGILVGKMKVRVCRQ